MSHGENVVPGEAARRSTGVAIACCAAGLFILLATPHLDAQGLYYDELHQASGSFLLLGKAPYLFAPIRWKQFPLLNMPYSGAFKTIMYGEWMRTTGWPFSIVSWRMFGILLAAGGLLTFLLLSRRALGILGSLLFAALFLTDTSVLLTSRHDWGPTALSLCLRLLWLGVWLWAEARGAVDKKSAFILGALPALLIYEKLNNVVLLVPFALVFLFTPGRALRDRVVLASGFILGLVPFAIVNVLGHGVSFRAAGVARPEPTPILDYAQHLLSLGSGAPVRSFILGVQTPNGIARWEAGTVLLALAISVLRARSLPSARRRTVLVCVGSYLGVALATWLLPQGTWAHHWIVATPFQYAAVALAFASPVSAARIGANRGLRSRAELVVSIVALMGILAPRAYLVDETERALYAGLASPAWSPSYTKLAQYVVMHQNEASFVLADWGFSTAIHALSDGSLRPEELFWSYSGRERLARLVGTKPFYVIARANSQPVDPGNTEAIFRDAAFISGNNSLPLEPALSLPDIKVLKFAAPPK